MNKDSLPPQHSYSGRVPEGYTDRLGHINHAAYLIIFENVRWDFLKEKGLHRTIETEQLGPVILDAHIRYHKELHQDDSILIQTWITKKSALTLVIHQKMFLTEQNMRLSSTLDLTLGLMDLSRRKLVQFPESWSRLLF